MESFRVLGQALIRFARILSGSLFLVMVLHDLLTTLTFDFLQIVRKKSRDRSQSVYPFVVVPVCSGAFTDSRETLYSWSIPMTTLRGGDVG